jgi:hypothetical protein
MDRLIRSAEHRAGEGFRPSSARRFGIVRGRTHESGVPDVGYLLARKL